MRADVHMEFSRSRQCTQQGQERHQAIDRRCTSCPDWEGTRETKDQTVTTMVQQCNKEKAENPQTAKSTEGKVQCSFGSLPLLNPERLRTAKARADKAVKMHKIFSVQGPYPVIRAALRARGWIEQRTRRPSCQAHSRPRDEGKASSNDTGDDDDENSDEVEEEQDQDGLHNLMSRLVRNEMVYFYWTNRRDAINTSTLQKEQITNHFAQAGSFSTKVGLCVNLRNLHWFDSADPDTFFPRSYRLAAQDEKHAFIEDYRRTACTGLLKYIVQKAQAAHGQEKTCIVQTVQSQRKGSRWRPKQVVLSQMIDTAVKVCQEFLESLDHIDIDKGLDMQQALSKQEWMEFIDSYYLVVHGRAEIQVSDHVVAICEAMLQRLVEVCPQLDIEGIHNIWIIKPGAQSRGRGIKCSKRLDQILKLVDGDSVLIKESKWVVQKYLEQPFLVHGTKFDIRQWFLVTDWNPLTVWFYKKCYMRFSTQPYSLDKLDSSVHLCNNSIQKHLRPSQQRHHGIPKDNMWSDDQFRTFLSSQGREAQWQAVVVPGMKKALIRALQTTQDLMDSRKNTFELYGADFMLGRDLNPWLIEINVSPTMAPSTPVTSQLCAAVQEDTLRVVLDRKADRTANTGGFELIYRQAAVEVPQYVGVNLLVKGFKIKSPCSLPPLRSFNRSASKHCNPAKEKEPAADKTKPLPRRSFKDSELKDRSTGVPVPPPPFKLKLSVPGPAEMLHLPTTVDRSVALPISARDHSVLLCRRRSEMSKVCSDREQLYQQSASLPLKITAPKQSAQAARSIFSL
ncbi:tubulin monoglycylase TTLL3-like isoform X2 [Cheilinus undulatus]|uniref:tubulin monoglycylase TTLL3-like isoform X2 n=1 Tax=Cheilinus undulatus TaxID=241271 RepID=UPI001BD43122|nr:tubulin monoglycylase TTLL3-like isoform X2 [Cheilinus undulatus]